MKIDEEDEMCCIAEEIWWNIEDCTTKDKKFSTGSKCRAQKLK